MSKDLCLPRYSLGVGDRFAREAEAQLAACQHALAAGVEIAPVWNKSNREHTIIGSDPRETRAAADKAVQTLGWKGLYFCDADHIGIKTVDRFLEPCDFFTIDVADWIGKPAEPAAAEDFARRHPELCRELRIPGITRSFDLQSPSTAKLAAHYLAAVDEAARIYQHIAGKKGEGRFVTEVSMDETGSPQTPAELLVILAAIADAGIPIQTIAPKFTGRFNKGVDYVGDLSQFAQEFADDLAVVAFAVEQYSLPRNLKLSVHSGSDKFSIYPVIHQALHRFDAGVHLKTAGTTWLEELIGLAESGGDGLALAQDIYAEAFAHREELCGPYATVIDIDPGKLPQPAEVARWSPAEFTSALRHDPDAPSYNSSLRQLLHVGFKVAAKMGSRYTSLVEQSRAAIARNVTDNLYNRHIVPVFLGLSPEQCRIAR